MILGDDLAVASDEIFLKVPRDITGDRLIRMMGQQFIKGGLIVALNRNLRKQVKRDRLLRTKLLDVLVGTRLLVSETVGWKCQNSEPAIFVFLKR